MTSGYIYQQELGLNQNFVGLTTDDYPQLNLAMALSAYHYSDTGSYFLSDTYSFDDYMSNFKDDLTSTEVLKNISDQTGYVISDDAAEKINELQILSPEAPASWLMGMLQRLRHQVHQMDQRLMEAPVLIVTRKLFRLLSAPMVMPVMMDGVICNAFLFLNGILLLFTMLTMHLEMEGTLLEMH